MANLDKHPETKCPACVAGLMPIEAYTEGETDIECALCMDTKTICLTCYAQMGVAIAEQKEVTNG
jgi:hypothetical protein